MTRKIYGGVLPKLLALVMCVGLIVLYWQWKANYGVIGHVAELDFSSRGYIAFIRQDGAGHTNVFAASADGTTEKQLTDDTNSKNSIDWSPDGKQIVYCAEVADDKYRAFQLFLLGKGDSRQLTHGTGSKSLPKWRADGKQLAYIVGGTLKVIDPNGDNGEQIYPPPHKGNENSGNASGDKDETFKKPPLSQFQWSPIGQLIASIQVLEGEDVPPSGSGNWFENNKDEKQKSEFASVPEPDTLLLIPGAEMQPIMRPDTNSVSLSFSWFPDGARMAVAASTRGGSNAIMIIRSDEQPSNDHPMVFIARGFTATAQNPVVSPDSSMVAAEVYKVDSSGAKDLLGIGVFSTDPEKTVTILNAKEMQKLDTVIKIKGKVTNPRWSPDGTRLLYQLTNENGKRDIIVCKADGSSPVNVTKGKGDHFDGVWSPAK